MRFSCAFLQWHFVSFSVKNSLYHCDVSGVKVTDSLFDIVYPDLIYSLPY